MREKITSLQHPLVKHFVKLRTNASYRSEKNSVLVIGNTLVTEISKHHTPKELFTLERVTPAILKKVTALLSPEEMVAEFEMPKEQNLSPYSKLLVIDQVADPGNLGTLLRTALALGWEGVFFLPGSVDPFNDKVMRSSRAALFSLPFCIGTWEDLMTLSKGFTPWVADTSGTPLSDIKKTSKIMLIMSNETHGTSTRMAQWAEKVTIPIAKMESLNVATAGAILMYEMNL